VKFSGGRLLYRFCDLFLSCLAGLASFCHRRAFSGVLLSFSLSVYARTGFPGRVIR
jgi:hypothetical protein